MTPVPVICDTCGRLWISESFIAVGEGATVDATMTGNKIGPCPHCSEMGSVPDGVYRLGHDTAELLGRLDSAQLKALLGLFTRARDEGTQPEVLAEQLEAELPEAVALRDFLGQGGAAFRDWLAIVIALVGLLVSVSSQQNAPLTQEQTKDAFVQALEQVKKDSATMSPPLSHADIGRNEPCPCGSGLKFKRCHGR